MAKRFTATEKWVDPWFCELQPLEKLFWVYLLDNCNHAGVWQVNWPLIRFYLGEFEFDQRVFNGRIVQLSEQKWYLPKFVEFQYGELNPENRAHLSVINILKKEGVYKGLNSPLDRGKDMDMVKDKDKDKGVVKGGFEEHYHRYPNKVGKKAAQLHFNATVKTEQDLLDINRALDNYLKTERVAKGFIQNASTWYNNWRDWITMPTATDSIPESMRRFMKKE